MELNKVVLVGKLPVVRKKGKGDKSAVSTAYQQSCYESQEERDQLGRSGGCGGRRKASVRHQTQPCNKGSTEGFCRAVAAIPVRADIFLVVAYGVWLTFVTLS